MAWRGYPYLDGHAHPVLTQTDDDATGKEIPPAGIFGK